ncbi:MAG: hypothetical protein Solumvirus4_5 [Solumvirus sp.]|uniref:Uncharacterized protein n=1 Tax=Solumvirus sp. TaxID=2487773 RepID=A0A3G5AGJ1_9VIRU|nr:MAG: hypothetical protein Solumvirus4_5 [Solumvirus sp.]
MLSIAGTKHQINEDLVDPTITKRIKGIEGFIWNTLTKEEYEELDKNSLNGMYQVIDDKEVVIEATYINGVLHGRYIETKYISDPESAPPKAIKVICYYKLGVLHGDHTTFKGEYNGVGFLGNRVVNYIEEIQQIYKNGVLDGWCSYKVNNKIVSRKLYKDGEIIQINKYSANDNGKLSSVFLGDGENGIDCLYNSITSVISMGNGCYHGKMLEFLDDDNVLETYYISNIQHGYQLLHNIHTKEMKIEGCRYNGDKVLEETMISKMSEPLIEVNSSLNMPDPIKWIINTYLIPDQKLLVDKVSTGLNNNQKKSKDTAKDIVKS